MPAYTGGGKKDPNNRLSTSDSLNTSDIWQKTIKYDPYASEDTQEAALDEGGINDRAKGLFELARITGVSKERPPGACKKCGQVGHLSFQCRNLMKLDSATLPIPEGNIDEEDDPDSLSESDDSSSSSSAKKKKKKKKKVKKKEKKKKKKKDKKASKDVLDQLRQEKEKSDRNIMCPPHVARKMRDEATMKDTHRRSRSRSRGRRRNRSRSDDKN